MSTPQRSLSTDTNADSNIRKRVCKACDRCRLKKSKCDGANPCSRCKADNAICVFGERKKAHDKVYPKGYVEMLEQQQGQLVSGLRELYKRLEAGETWPGPALADAHNGYPLTHDILERLDLLQSSGDGHSQFEGFEEDPMRMQRRLLDNGATYVHRRGSLDSDSEQGHASSPSSYGTPPSPQHSHFKEPFVMSGTPPTPTTADNSPFGTQAHLATMNAAKMPPYVFPSTMQTGLNPNQIMQQQAWPTQTPAMDETADFIQQFDATMGYDVSYSQYNTTQPMTTNMNMMDWNDPIDLDFKDFIQASS
ncbi:hypothetical protein K402DRAFT_151002 [Aulographum hederae CBS 113979]|uniref:Zn(2)-C6 fungal-type domain-containing protein n=1 Tax=Aulographum hederae CBS 113979 TaxID=1176131 RepID=A0A6G1GTL1_9PEZI|nr:hypothetical protein K402DRAFT_151002 [Aulographum hederae CBS 113979]